MSIVTVPLRGHQAALGAAFFLVAEGRWVRPSSIQRCHSGAWLNSGAVLSVNRLTGSQILRRARRIPSGAPSCRMNAAFRRGSERCIHAAAKNLVVRQILNPRLTKKIQTAQNTRKNETLLRICQYECLFPFPPRPMLRGADLQRRFSKP